MNEERNELNSPSGSQSATQETYIMTGGTVIVTNGDYNHIEIVVEDDGEQLAIKVEVNEDSRAIETGDSMWWQGRKAYWTPTSLDGYRDDIEIARIGYSYKPAVSIL